jgi:hypothetical protein
MAGLGLFICRLASAACRPYQTQLAECSAGPITKAMPRCSTALLPTGSPSDQSRSLTTCALSKAAAKGTLSGVRRQPGSTPNPICPKLSSVNLNMRSCRSRGAPLAAEADTTSVSSTIFSAKVVSMYCLKLCISVRVYRRVEGRVSRDSGSRPQGECGAWDMQGVCARVAQVTDQG